MNDLSDHAMTYANVRPSQKNKIKSMTILVMLVLGLNSVFLAACAKSNPIIGAWTEKIATMTFYEDGTVMSRLMGEGAWGTYQFLDEETIRITFYGNNLDYKFTIVDDTLYLNMENIKLTLYRIK
jgi:hypothetical protein